MLLQWLAKHPLQAIGSPVPKSGPHAIWAMDEGKFLSLKGARYYLFEAENLPGPCFDRQCEPQMRSPWGSITASDAMEGKKQPLGDHFNPTPCPRQTSR